MSGILMSAVGNWKVASAAASAALVYNLDAAALGARPSSSITTSASFDGSTQYFDIASTTAFGFSTTDFTIEFWSDHFLSISRHYPFAGSKCNWIVY